MHDVSGICVNPGGLGVTIPDFGLRGRPARGVIAGGRRGVVNGFRKTIYPSLHIKYVRKRLLSSVL